jgi:hypothetical protein
MLVHACNPSTPEAEARGLRVSGQVLSQKTAKANKHKNLIFGTWVN